MKGDHKDFALRMQQAYKKQYENDFLEIFFLKGYDYGEPVWFKNYKRKTYDCRRCDRVHESGIKLTCAEFAEYLSEEKGHEVTSCLFHMSDAEVDDLIAESMKEKFYEMVDSMMLQKATLDVRKEWELAFDQRHGYRYNRYGYISLEPEDDVP